MKLGLQKNNISLEIFPFVKEKNNIRLSQELRLFENNKPKFTSITYGASGSIQNNTLSLATRISNLTSLNLAAHLTCVNSKKEFIKDLLNIYWNKNIRSIVAIGGDKPKIALDSDYNFAFELVEDIKKNNDFYISVGFHPEGHPKDKNIRKEINNLKKKFDHGANQAISQFFFNKDYFLKFRDALSKESPNIKLVPGILLISNFEMIERFAKKCKTTIPKEDKKIFYSCENPNNIPENISIEYTYNLCEKLKSEGVEDFHIYTLNKLKTTSKLLKILM